MTDVRTILPNRRGVWTFAFMRGLIEYVVSYGTFGWPGMAPPRKVSEVFITSRKIGSELEATARDAAIILSLALQYGCPLDTIRHSVTRNQDGTPQSLIGDVIDRVDTEARQ